MSTDGGGAGLWNNVASLMASPGTRTALLAVLASAALGFSIQSRRPPAVPDKEESDRSSRRLRPSYSSSSLVESKNSIAIFWDVDNCAPPTGASGHTVAQAIRKAAQGAARELSKSESNVSIVSFKGYLELTTEGSQPSAARVQLHSELQGSGVSLIDTPKSGRKDVADKMMITDLLSFAIDKRPPALIVLLSGDRDFAYPLGILRNRGYEILLVVPPIGATPILEASANHVMRWRQDVLSLERDGYGRPYNKTAPAAKQQGSITPAKSSLPPVVKEKESEPEKSKITPKKVVSAAPSSPPKQAFTAALKGPGAPPVPAIFQPLVRVLEQMRKEGYARPLRSMCALRLLSQEKNVYEKAGATSWGDYTAVAEAAGIVTLGGGGKPGTEWIALRSIADEGKHTRATLIEEPSKDKAPNAAVMDDISVFYPLIEAHRSLRSSLPKNDMPTMTQMAAHITQLWDAGLRDAYVQAGVSNFHDYMALAEQAKVGRVVKSEGNGGKAVVQIHPEYLNIQTNLNPASSSSTGGGGSDAKAIESFKASDIPQAAGEQTPAKKDKDSKESKTPLPDAATPAATPSQPKGGEKGVYMHAHLPSGEKINISFFPLANILLTQRAGGKMTCSDTFVHHALSKHPKAAPLVTTPEQFSSYLIRAERDNIITCAVKGGKRFVTLDPRLAKGEEEHDWSRLKDGTAMKRVESETSPEQPPSPEKKATNGSSEGDGLVSQRTPSPSFNSEPAGSQERVIFKPLVQVLVGMRRAAPEKNEEPSRARVSLALVQSNPVDGEVLSPGAWIQMHGYAGFADFYQAAQRKGFVHLIKSGVDGKERVRLSEKYESMFFS